MLTVIFSAPSVLPPLSCYAALNTLHARENIGLVVATDKAGNQYVDSWKHFMGKAVVKVNTTKYKGAAQKLANCTALIHYSPDMALICPGAPEEADLIARCLDADIPVVLFDMDGKLHDTLTKKAMQQWQKAQSK
jgi:hypothetical protein